MRVATRRLRAFLRAGHTLLDPEWSGRFREELSWLGGALGPVRDLDVLLGRLSSEVQSLGEDAPAGRQLLARLKREHRTARRRLLAVLDSDRYFALLEALEEAVITIADEPSLEEIHAAEHRRLRKAVRALGPQPPDDELHAVRIRVKRARYAAELADRQAYVKAAKSLQDVLGEHQDAVVAGAATAGARAGGPTPPSPPGGCSNARGRGHGVAGRVGGRMEAAREDGVEEIRASGGLVVRDGASSSYTGPSTTTGRCQRGRRAGARATRTARCARSRRRPASGASSARGSGDALRDTKGTAEARALVAMPPLSGSSSRAGEVDDLRWLTPGGRALLTYERDVELLDEVF